MDQILDRIKERVAQRDSPVRTVKGVIEAIGMSEAGFYTMLKRGTTKQGTLLSIAQALKVEPQYLTNDLDRVSETEMKLGGNVEDIFERFDNRLQEIRQAYEEQLRVKDRQIDGLQRTVDALVGKSEGVPVMPLSTDEEFEKMITEYKGKGMGIAKSYPFIFSTNPVGKLVAPLFSK